MIVLVSGATGYPRDATVGHLIVPRKWNDPRTLDLQPGRWAMDNGGFSGVDPGAFLRMLYAYREQRGCRFVTVPDTVADAAETLQQWAFWSPLVRALGHAPAFVAQDGLTPERVPWADLGALFIGGSDAYKESADALALCGYAKARGIWLHWGRVNGQRRYRKAVAAGADSIDGSGFSIAPDTNIPLVAEWDATRQQQPGLRW